MDSATASARYDRQIRVWGKEAQGRLMTAKVLLAGLSGLNVEVAKNLALAGVNVTLQDDQVVSSSDMGVNFFLTAEHMGVNRAQASLSFVQELNPLSQMEALTVPLNALDDAYLSLFDVIVYCGYDTSIAMRINQLMRLKTLSSNGTNVTGGSFWCVSSGPDGIFFSDFGANFQFLPDPSTGNNQNNSNSNSNAQNKPAVKTFTEHLSFSDLFNVPLAYYQDNARISNKLFPLSRVLVKTRLLLDFEKEAKSSASPLDVLQRLYAGYNLPSNPFTPQDLETLYTQHAHQTHSIYTHSILGSMC
eukprot:gene40407-49241_t